MNMPDPLTAARITSTITDVGYAQFLIRDENLALAVFVAAFMVCVTMLVCMSAIVHNIQRFTTLYYDIYISNPRDPATRKP